MIPLKDDNPTSTFPFVTVFIIVLNTLIFIFQMLIGASLGTKGLEYFIYKTAAIPYEIVHLTDIHPRNFLPPPFTLLTAMFVHGNLFHLLGNMLYLWIFGDNIEDRLGHFKFIIFYLGTGVVASLAHIAVNPSSTTPLIGASGAIAGVLGAYFLLFPRAYVVTLIYVFIFVDIVRIPAVVFLGIWFFFQVISSTAGGGIAWYAHIGGFLAGTIIILLARSVGSRRYRGVTRR